MASTFSSPLAQYNFSSPGRTPESPTVFGLEDELNAAMAHHDKLTESNKKLKNEIASISSNGQKSLNILNSKKKELDLEYEKLKKTLESIPEKGFLLSQQEILEEYIKIYCSNAVVTLNLSPLMKYGIMRRTDNISNLGERIEDFSKRYEKWKMQSNLWPLKFIFEKNLLDEISDEEHELMRKITILDSTSRSALTASDSEKQNLSAKLFITKDQQPNGNRPASSPLKPKSIVPRAPIQNYAPFNEVINVLKTSGANPNQLIKVTQTIYKLGNYIFSVEKTDSAYVAVLGDNKKILLPFLVKEYLNQNSSFVMSI